MGLRESEEAKQAEEAKEFHRGNVPLINLVEEWKNCQKCPYGLTATNHVLFEMYPNQFIGDADLMIVGEGPGVAENITGRPFIGKSGQVLRKCLSKIKDGVSYRSVNWAPVKVIITNVVACRPGKNEGTQLSSMDACYPRIKELIRIFQPRHAIAMGKLPYSYLQMRGIQCELTWHPSYLARIGQSESGDKYDQFESTLRRGLA